MSLLSRACPGYDMHLPVGLGRAYARPFFVVKGFGGQKFQVNTGLSRNCPWPLSTRVDTVPKV